MREQVVEFSGPLTDQMSEYLPLLLPRQIGAWRGGGQVELRRIAGMLGQVSSVKRSRDTPQFYLTAPSPCPYLPGQEERKVFTHLVGERAGELNNLLTHGGFRRSQSIAYRPACERCRACVSVRVIANEFCPTRNMRRVLDRNR